MILMSWSCSAIITARKKSKNMNFYEQPSGIVGANSPLLYQFYDSNYALAGFYYEVKVYVWSGTASLPATPKVTVHRKPDQYGAGRGWVDTHKIVQQYLTTEALIYGTYKPNIGSMAVYTNVVIRGVWDAGASTTITGNYVIATNGYAYTSEGLNANFGSKYIYTDQTSLLLTSATKKYYVWFDASRYTSISCGTNTQSPNAVTNSSTRIQGIEIVKLITDGGQWGNNTTINFTHAGGVDTLRVNSNCPSKYGEVCCLFMNKYGVWDSYVFNAISKTTMSVTDESYEQPIYRTSDLGVAWDYGVQIKNKYNVQTVDRFTINSEWVGDNTTDVFRQFVASDMILTDETTQYLAAQVSDNNLQVKRVNTDKLFQYTFNLERAQPLINKIVR